MNKKTVALTTEQYREIIHTMKQGLHWLPSKRAGSNGAGPGGQFGASHFRYRAAPSGGYRQRRRAIPPVHRRAEDGESQDLHGAPCPVSVHPLLLPGPRYSAGADHLSHHGKSHAEAAQISL